jgi:hypothetical protein
MQQVRLAMPVEAFRGRATHIDVGLNSLNHGSDAKYDKSINTMKRKVGSIVLIDILILGSRFNSRLIHDEIVIFGKNHHGIDDSWA